jgi:protein tyrosine/serine phosphatase
MARVDQRLPTRALVWDGCVNVRDLGGLPTEDGRVTVEKAVVRSDNVRRLSDDGWAALLHHGVRTVVDLRWGIEMDGDPPRDVEIDVHHVSLLGEYDPRYGRDLDVRLGHLTGAERTAAVYADFLDRFGPNFGRAVGVVADAAPGGVLIHCVAGKDRTGLISALLLRVVGVPVDVVADDYALSAQYLEALTRAWIDEATDEEERAARARMGLTPREAMLSVLERLEDRHRGVDSYLLKAGVTAAQLDRIRERLVA